MEPSKPVVHDDGLKEKVRKRDKLLDNLSLIQAQIKATIDNRKEAESAEEATKRVLSVAWREYQPFWRRQKELYDLSQESATAKVEWEAFRYGYGGVPSEFELKRDAYRHAKTSYDNSNVDHETADTLVRKLQDDCAGIDWQIERQSREILAILTSRLWDDNDNATLIRQLAEQLDISQYVDDIQIKFEVTRVCNVFFGGQQSEKSHGHIVIKPNGIVRYYRLPDQPLGSQNYISGLSRVIGGERRGVGRNVARIAFNNQLTLQSA